MFNFHDSPVVRALLVTLGVLSIATTTRGASARFVVEDDAFLDQVCNAAAKLKDADRLVPLRSLQCQLNRQFAIVHPAAPAATKLSPPDLYDRLLQSTFAVGDFYQCDTCTNWHFNAATAFVVASNGVLCTSYHVVGNGEEPLTDKPDFLVAADRDGHVYPVREVLAADPDADTCLLKIDATDLKPLPIRPSARTGERVYCLGHPEGNHFLFSEGMVARVMRSHDVMSLLEPDGEHTAKSRPTIYLNVTAEFSPGSSGGPIVDEAGNVLAQVQSITSNVESDSTNSIGGAFVGGPVRYCVAAEEILRLTQPPPGYHHPAPLSKPPGFQPDSSLRETELLDLTRRLFERSSNALVALDAPLIASTLFKRFDTCAQVHAARFPASTNAIEVDLLRVRAWLLREDYHCDQVLKDPQQVLHSLNMSAHASTAQRAEAGRLKLLLLAQHTESPQRLSAWEQLLSQHRANFLGDSASELDLKHLELVESIAPRRLEALARELSKSTDEAVAAAAQQKLESLRPTGRSRRGRSE